MPTLADTLKNNKPLVRGPNGELTETTPEETKNLQQLSGQVGIAPPTTPMGAAVIGATPDQAKMAGTPAQKQSALTIAQQPDTTLQDTLRRNQVRSQATAQEQQGIQKSADMQNLGSLGDRVAGFIDTQRQALQAQSGQGVAVDAASTYAGPHGANQDLSGLKDMLAQFRQNPSDQNLLVQLNTALGYSPDRPLSPTEVDSLYQSTNDAIAKGGATTVADNLTVNDLVSNPAFGYDTHTLSQLLGVPEDAVSKMSVSDLRNQVQKVTADEFNKTQALGQKATSGELGQAERGLARQAGQEASRTGQRSSEADMAHLDQQIANADQVQFGGKAYRVDDLLKDDTISGIISDYMNSAPGSDTRNQIDKTEPALSAFINKNQAVLADASAQMQQGAQTFSDTQAANKALANLGGIQLTGDVASKLIPGFGTFQAQKIDPNTIPVLQYAAQGGPQRQTKIADELNAADPATVQQLSSLTPQEVANLGIDKSDGIWNTLKQNKEVSKHIASITDPNNLAIFAYGVGADKLASMATTARSMSVLGMGTGGLDPEVGAVVGPDGNVDMNALKFYAMQKTQTPNLKDAANGGVTGFQSKQIGQLQSPTGLDGSILSKLSKDAAKGSINYGDLVNNGITLDEAIRLQDTKGKGQINPSDVDKRQGELRNQNTDTTISGIMDSQLSRSDKILALQDGLNKQGDRRLDTGKMQGQMTQLANDELTDTLAHAAEDRDATRQRLRQQKQLVSMVIPAFSAMPPSAQDAIMDTATQMGKGALDAMKDVKWDNSKTIPENLTEMAIKLNTTPYKGAVDAVAAGLKTAGQDVGGYAGGIIKDAGHVINTAKKFTKAF